MPYEVRRVPGGWKVFKQGTDEAHSKSPMPKATAEAQMRALYAAEADQEKK